MRSGSVPIVPRMWAMIMWREPRPLCSRIITPARALRARSVEVGCATTAYTSQSPWTGLNTKRAPSFAAPYRSLPEPARVKVPAS